MVLRTISSSLSTWLFTSEDVESLVAYTLDGLLEKVLARTMDSMFFCIVVSETNKAFSYPYVCLLPLWGLYFTETKTTLWKGPQRLFAKRLDKLLLGIAEEATGLWGIVGCSPECGLGFKQLHYSGGFGFPCRSFRRSRSMVPCLRLGTVLH